MTIGPQGSPAYRFISAFATVTEAAHPRVHIDLVPVDSLAGSAKAIEDHTTDLGIIRSDAEIPSNGETIAILRRDVIAFIVPSNSSIDKVQALTGKAVAIPQGPVSSYNDKTLDRILSYYDIPEKSVKRVFLPITDIGTAVREKHVAAVLAVGPMAPGDVVDVVNAIKLATKAAPTLLGIDEADAINKRFPGLESIDVPAGALRARPPVPDDTVTTLAITYRFVAPDTMLNAVAGAIARSLLKTKAQLMAKTPLASQIEAPDPDEGNPLLPVHPGVASYLSSGEQSFFEEFQQYFYVGGMALSLIGSAITVFLGRLRSNRSAAALRQIDRLIAIADKALSTQAIADLKPLDDELNEIVAWCVHGRAAEGNDSAAFSIAIDHARRAIQRQRLLLGQGAP
ncbi:TAXI family TRAP transporter solute-binding subunit [uncultured Thiodictyon sp.]|uniref:TAXI family TRAP transporter solute-binding subunit n=1 Tax=uncultured Thiodictyon sp. TaxID=1846217 RepID=UPI0025E9EB33|nr:TAXI family TRAP transporter solute-binding subunit [uncultured Thiodictyon sp.]